MGTGVADGEHGVAGGDRRGMTVEVVAVIDLNQMLDFYSKLGSELGTLLSCIAVLQINETEARPLQKMV